MLQIIIYIFISVISVVLAWWFYFKSTRFYKLCSQIPGPAPLPVLGNIELFLNRRILFLNVAKVLKQFPMICRLFLVNVCIVVLMDANDIYKILNSSEALSKFRFYKPVSLILGENILTAQTEDWRRYRKMLRPGFNTKVIRNFIDVFNEKSKTLVKMLESKCDKKQFDVYEMLNMAALDMIATSMFGIDFKVLENNNTKIVSNLRTGKRLIQKLGFSPLHWFEIVLKNSNFNIKAKELLEIDREFMEPAEKCIKKSETKFNEKTYIDENRGQKMIDYIVNFRDKNTKNFTDIEVLDQIRILGLVGSDTTAFTVSACLMLLGIYKDVQDKVAGELHDIFGDNINRSVEYDDLQKMIYTEQVIKETMRLFPVALLTGRKILQDIQVSGYVLPAGTDVVFSTYQLHRNPNYFPDPLKFDPERFTPENIRSRNPHCFIPFLTGPRNCIGHYYAMLQMKTVICHLLRQFEFLPSGSRENMEEISMEMVLCLKHGYNVRIKLRNV